MILALLLACGGPDPAALSLEPWPDDPDALSAICDQQAFPELATTCRVQAASRYGRRGDEAGADRSCAAIAEGTWRDECHFRAGEELGQAGKATAALRHCGQAGAYARNCLTHAGWHLPADPSLTSALPPATIAAAADELRGAIDQALGAADAGVQGEGRDIFLSRFGFNLSVGSGLANPAPAHLDDPLGVVLRTGFGIEAARLVAEPSADAILAVWAGTAPAPTGPVLEERARVGNYTPPVPAPLERDLARAPVFGGGMRLVGESPDEDALIAALEGLYWTGRAPAAEYQRWTGDARPRVRWTAAKLLALVVRDSDPTQLAALAAAATDEGVKWHLEAVQHRREPPGRRR